MQIVIPMSGSGSRFLDAGYRLPKPLIEVDGRPMIEHVVGLFPGERDFLFVCSTKHLAETPLAEVLARIAPGGRIVPIEPHKYGPVHAVAHVFEAIRDDDEVIVNYCDFGKYWDYRDFLEHTRTRRADGALPAYRGFHPHMLGSTNYAFMRDADQWLLEIREKQPFTTDRMSEYASDGTYYFRSGSLLKNYCRRLLQEDIQVNGEYYASMVYNLLVRDGLRVSIYEIQHMLQWGTPEDVEEYQRWSDYFARALEPQRRPAPQAGSITVIPMAGRGERFSRAGYTTPKPLIEIGGRPMVLQAAASLPRSERTIFVCRAGQLDSGPLMQTIAAACPTAKFVRVEGDTQGQACSVELGLAGEDPEAPLFVGACDNGMRWDSAAYQALLDDPGTDAVVWSFRQHRASARNPQMYGWIDADATGLVRRVSVKVPISGDPFNDHAIVGAFYFRRARYFLEALRRLVSGDTRVNNEFYVDSTVNELVAMGLRARVFAVQDYLCWGTPDDLRTYEYWQSFFHKCSWHPYRLDRDPAVTSVAVESLDRRYRTFSQPHRQR